MNPTKYVADPRHMRHYRKNGVFPQVKYSILPAMAFLRNFSHGEMDKIIDMKAKKR